MILPKRQITELRTVLEEAQRPLFFYDDDPDGLCSFLLLYRFKHEGRGVLVKTTSTLTKNWARHVDEYKPDVVFILDVPSVDQDFIDAITVPIYWIDHHTPTERDGIHYYNPRLEKEDAYIPTTRMAYEIVQQDLWIAGIGCVADWHLPDFKEELIHSYPALITTDVNDAETALFDTPLGKLARILSFLLKGKTGEVLKCIKILTRIKEPDELLQGTTPQGKFIAQRFEKISEKYDALLHQATQKKPHGEFLLFKYEEDQWSFTSDLGNELSHRYPDKVVVVCRERNGEYKCSLRARKKPLLPAVQKALEGVQGRGGGHEQACGAVIVSEDFETFFKNLKREY